LKYLVINVEGVQLAIDLRLSYPARDQLRVLRPKVEDKDLVVHSSAGLPYSTW